jgi:two-component system nitrate/nitrite response regulator NarL
MGGPIRVAVVDDHPLFREGVASVLHGVGGFEVVGQGGGSADLLKLARDFAPDVILADVDMSQTGMNAIRHVVEACPNTRLVMLTMSECEAHVSTVMKSGVAGYVLKGVTGAELARTVRDIHLGARYVDPTLAARILARQVAAPGASPGALTELTSREGQIVGQVARGLTNKEVARALTLSEKTVKHYMTSIMQKLQVRNRTELVLVASSKLESDDSRPTRNIA